MLNSQRIQLYRKLLFLGFLLSTSFSQNFAIVKIADVPAKAIYLTQPKGDDSRLFVVNQKGLIYIIKNGKTVNKPFLDISDRVHGSLIPGSEEGLLGMAFHPNYFENGFFYVNYVNKNDTSIVARFSVTDNPEYADQNSELILLKIAQPFGNHNGGPLIFGPKDGMLYIGFGDGGKWGDPFNNAQNQNTLLGKILRIDVNRGNPYAIPPDNPFVGQKDKKSEIFCYGLRNPWRFSFDRLTNDLVIGDVGQNLWEEVNWNTWEESNGANYGWRIMAADHCYNPEQLCDTTGLMKPIHEYPNNANYMKILIGMDEAEATGCSVTGGYVYRGTSLPNLQGAYIFGDYCTGRIWAFQKKNNQITNFMNIRTSLKKTSKALPLFISSFGEDNSGELYVVDYLGAIYKFVPY